MTRANSSRYSARDSFRLRLKQANAIQFSSLLLEGGVLQIANGKSDLLDELVGSQMVLSDRPPDLLALECAGDLVYSVSVLKAFTVELYLKALLHLERKEPPRKHDLLELYRMLGFRNKQLLKDKRREVIVGPSYSDAEEVLHKDLETTLKEHRNDFVDIRYQEIPGQAMLTKVSDGMVNMTAAVYTCQLVCLAKPEGLDSQSYVGQGFRSVLDGPPSSD